MNGSPHISLIGAFLALLFSGTMFSIIWWMLHPPPQVTLPVAKARIAVSAIKKIIVPTTGTSYSEKAVELACRLGQAQKAEILVTYVIEVPYTLPLNAVMTKAELMAQDVINRAIDIVRHNNLPARSTIEHARKVGEGIIRLAKVEDADLIVIGIRPVTGIPEKVVGRTSETVLRHAPCEVIINYNP